MNQSEVLTTVWGMLNYSGLAVIKATNGKASDERMADFHNRLALMMGEPRDQAIVANSLTNQYVFVALRKAFADSRANIDNLDNALKDIGITFSEAHMVDTHGTVLYVCYYNGAPQNS